jgi:hypothetical protein
VIFFFREAGQCRNGARLAVSHSRTGEQRRRAPRTGVQQARHEGKAMQYSLLIYETPKAFAARSDQTAERLAYVAAWRTFYQSMVDAGIYVGGNPLQGPETGTTVRVSDRGREIQDGPYADTKEQLGGFVLLELPSLDAALEWAARCPAASVGAVEVRPVATIMMDTIANEERAAS